MSARAPMIAYLVTKGDTTSLRVLVNASGERSRAHNFPLDILGVARLASESAAILQTAIQRGATPASWTSRKSRRRA